MPRDSLQQRPGTQDVLRRMVEDDHHLIETVPQTAPEGCFGARHILAFLGFLGFANVYAMRVNLSVAIVAMVNNTAIPHTNKNESDVCPASADNTTHPVKDGEFPWGETEQGLILGAFFYGYVLTNMLGGRLGELVGGKIVFGIGVLVTSIMTIFTPVVARASTPLFIALRVIEGLGEGVTFPAMNSMMAKWVPPLERSKMSSLVYAGAQFGTVISLPISGLLCQSSFLGGWPAVFYVFGVCGLLWFIVWMLLVHNTPESHPRISLDEKIYIQTTLNQSPSNTKSGFISALPYLVMWLFSIAAGQVADHLRARGILSTTATRKIFNSIGIYGPMICLVLVGYAGCHKDAAIALLCGAVGLNGATLSGYINSHLDIAPNFAGTLMGITNTAATIPGFLAPQLVGYLITGKMLQECGRQEALGSMALLQPRKTFSKAQE
ncbi:inorganic phosphate cotransporter-like 6 [Homarus americanus]|uniref:Sialin n=1 Tax=Homarus americanus TaxID=6706 RepID=A0A8J5JLV9_HOMAM|nr:inorganic phosphate cotransporter-like 6 [Homarus americanus]